MQKGISTFSHIYIYTYMQTHACISMSISEYKHTNTHIQVQVCGCLYAMSICHTHITAVDFASLLEILWRACKKKCFCKTLSICFAVCCQNKILQARLKSWQYVAEYVAVHASLFEFFWRACPIIPPSSCNFLCNVASVVNLNRDSWLH